MESNAVNTYDPIAQAEREANEELLREVNEAAKRAIKASLKRIADAERIVANERIRHNALLADLRAR